VLVDIPCFDVDVVHQHTVGKSDLSTDFTMFANGTGFDGRSLSDFGNAV
jgi:hypothetical protein